LRVCPLSNITNQKPVSEFSGRTRATWRDVGRVYAHPATLILLACRSDVEVAMVNDDADYYSNRNDKGEDTCHEKKLDGDHLSLPTDAMSKVEKASRKDISPKEQIFMTNLHVRLSKRT